MREWIEEGRFVASVAGYALTGDTLHQGPNTWPVAGLRADVFDGTGPRETSIGSEGPVLDEPPANPANLVVQITLADDTLILIEVPVKKRGQTHLFARKINQASVYFTAKTNRSPDSARTT